MPPVAQVTSAEPGHLQVMNSKLFRTGCRSQDLDGNRCHFSRPAPDTLRTCARHPGAGRRCPTRGGDQASARPPQSLPQGYRTTYLILQPRKPWGLTERPKGTGVRIAGVKGGAGDEAGRRRGGTDRRDAIANAERRRGHEVTYATCVQIGGESLRGALCTAVKAAEPGLADANPTDRRSRTATRCAGVARLTMPSLGGDHLTKPFPFAEPVVRIRALGR